MPGSRQPPHDIAAEQAVLAGILQFADEYMAQVAALLRAEDFYDQRHGFIYEAMLWLYANKGPTDDITVISRLRDTGKLDVVGGIESITSLSNVAIIDSHIEYYAAMVRNKALLRKFILAATQAIDAVYHEQETPEQTLEEAERKIFASTQLRYAQETVSMGKLMEDVVNRIQQRKLNHGAALGITTGYSRLDRLTNGWQPSDLIIIAGRPGMGKSALAMNMGVAAAKSGATVGVFSLEMSTLQLGTRLLSSEAKISFSKLNNSAFLGPKDFESIVSAADRLSQLPLYIDETPVLSILELRAKTRRLKSKHNLGIIIIDYLQLMRGSRERFDNREQEISEISRSLKALAKELNIPVIALAQLNRKLEDRGDKRPQLSDLRESGAIEQDADIIAFIYREGTYNKAVDSTVAEIIIGKQRNGPTGMV
jgi:replicative DNA helicase